MRRVADAGQVRDDVRAEALHEAEALVADRAHLRLEAFALPFAHLVEREAQCVGIEAAAQALVRGDDDETDRLHALALGEERMAVLGVGVREVGSDGADLVAVGARMAHALLRLAHLGRGDHLHRLGDLARVLHALDLVSDFFRPRHVLS